MSSGMYKRCNTCRNVKDVKEFTTGDYICNECKEKQKKGVNNG